MIAPRTTAPRVAAWILALSSCRPSGGTSDGSSSSSPGSGSTSDAGTSATTAASESAGASDDTTGSPEPRVDIFQPDHPMLCGIERPEECSPTWPVEEQLAGYDEAVVVEIDGRWVVVVSPVHGEWGLLFDLPCPVDLGAPEVVQTRLEMPGQVDMWGFGEFELYVDASYPAIVDVEYFNSCMHMLVHGIEVDPEPIEPDDPPFESYHQLRTGYVHAGTL